MTHIAVQEALMERWSNSSSTSMSALCQERTERYGLRSQCTQVFAFRLQVAHRLVDVNKGKQPRLSLMSRWPSAKKGERLVSIGKS
jgi:hypothetical protein